MKMQLPPQIISLLPATLVDSNDKSKQDVANLKRLFVISSKTTDKIGYLMFIQTGDCDPVGDPIRDGKIEHWFYDSKSFKEACDDLNK